MSQMMNESCSDIGDSQSAIRNPPAAAQNSMKAQEANPFKASSSSKEQTNMTTEPARQSMKSSREIEAHTLSDLMNTFSRQRKTSELYRKEFSRRKKRLGNDHRHLFIEFVDSVKELQTCSLQSLISLLHPILKLLSISAEFVSKILLLLILIEFSCLFFIGCMFLPSAFRSTGATFNVEASSLSSLYWLCTTGFKVLLLCVVPLFGSIKLFKLFKIFRDEATRLEKAVFFHLQSAGADQVGGLSAVQRKRGFRPKCTKLRNFETQISGEYRSTESQRNLYGEVSEESSFTDDSSREATSVEGTGTWVAAGMRKGKIVPNDSEKSLVSKAYSLGIGGQKMHNEVKAAYWETDGESMTFTGTRCRGYPRIVPQSNSPVPPVTTWPFKPVYARFIEEMWVLKELVRSCNASSQSKKRTEAKNALPSYTTKYPLNPLYLKDNNEVSEDHPAVNDFETPFFKGKILLRLADAGIHVDMSYFDGKKRFTQACIQGQFKAPYKFHEVLTGQIFDHQFSSMPPPWLLKLGFAIVRKLAPNIQDDITAESPFVLSPLITAAQTVHVAHQASSESYTIAPPDITQHQIPENTKLIGSSFAGKELSSSERRGFFRNVQNLNNYRFSTDYVYTFDFYQHIFNAGTYEFNLGVTSLDLAPLLSNQPVEIMAVLEDSLFALNPEQMIAGKESTLSQSDSRDGITEELTAEAVGALAEKMEPIGRQRKTGPSPTSDATGKSSIKEKTSLSNPASDLSPQQKPWAGWFSNLSSWHPRSDGSSPVSIISSTAKGHALTKNARYLWRVQLCHEKVHPL